MSLSKLKEAEMDDLDLWNDKEDFSDKELDAEDEQRLKNLQKTVNEISGKKKQDEIRYEDERSISTIRSNKTYYHGDLVTSKTVSEDMKDVKRKIKKTKLVELPIEEIKDQEIQRKMAYEEAVVEATKWEPLVEANRKVKNMQFPLVNEKPIKIIDDTPVEFQMPCQPRSKLEMKVASILKENKTLESDKKPLSVLERRAMMAMNLQEAKEMRARLQKERLQRSYQMAKLKRQGKIKSKKYHRIQKKVKEKEEVNKMEAMKERDPEAYKEWLLKEDRRRIEERMTLKHKKGNKFMKQQQMYAKFNDEGRQAVQDMIQKGKELTTKIDDDDDDDEIDDDDDARDSGNEDAGDDINDENTAYVDDDEESDDDVEDDEEEDDDGKEGFIGKVDDDDDEEDCASLNEGLDRVKNIEDIEELGEKNLKDNEDDDDDDEDVKLKVHDDDDEDKTKSNLNKLKKKDIKKKTRSKAKENNEDIQPDEYFKIAEEADLNTNDTSNKKQKITKNKNNKALLKEAMEADDLVEEFVKEKRQAEERDQVKDFHQLTFDDMSQWAGPSFKPFEKKKKNRNIIKAPRLKRKDEGMSAVILSESKDQAIAKHQINRLPRNMKSVKKFQENFKKPIGKTWAKEEDYWKKIRPKVSVQMGAIVDPIDKSNLISKNNDGNFDKVLKGKKVKGQKPAGKKRKFPKLINKETVKKLKTE